jgi:hypothetical protein
MTLSFYVVILAAGAIHFVTLVFRIQKPQN